MRPCAERAAQQLPEPTLVEREPIFPAHVQARREREAYGRGEAPTC